MALPEDTSVEGEYADGFILNETDQHDCSPYTDGQNTFTDILEKRPEADHGPLVRFSLFYKNARYDVDWRGLPTTARPIRYRHGFSTLHKDGTVVYGWSGVEFGYQYTDEQGRNVKEVQELR